MANIGIIGSGNVGANTAFFLAERSVGDVTLYDIQEGLSKGKSLDMMEAAPIRGYQRHIQGAESMTDLKDSDVLIITAGSVREPGMEREDLYSKNKEIILRLASELKGIEARIIMVTEPVDLLTTLFIKEAGFPPEQVMGLGGMLDSTRLRYLLSKELGVAVENVTATIIGRHSKEMIPLPGYTCVSGVPVELLLPKEKLDALYTETAESGDLIVNMAQRASAYYAPSAAAAEIAEAIIHDSKHIVPLSVLLTGQYGISDAAMSLPCVVGAGGIEKIMEPKLTDEQLKALTASGESIKSIVGAR